MSAASYSGDRVTAAASSIPSDRRAGDPACTPGGRIAYGSPDDARLRLFVAGRAAIPLAATSTMGWSLQGHLAAGRIDDAAGHAAALDAAIRGADVVVDVVAGRLESFRDDAARASIAEWRPPSPGPDRGWAVLLDALAAGDSIEQAARRCHLSLRSAHRKLAIARAELGVTSTAAAVARWAGRSGTAGSAVDE